MQIGKESIVISFNVENRGETNIVERNKRIKGILDLVQWYRASCFFFFFKSFYKDISIFYIFTTFEQYIFLYIRSYE